MLIAGHARLAAPSVSRLAVLAFAGLAAVGFTGCQPSAQSARVRLHNDASDWVAARIVITKDAAGTTTTSDTTVIRRVLGPGASDTLGPIAVPAHGSLRLVLEPADREDFILRAPVPEGLTAYHVGRPLGLARLDLTPAAVNPEWTYAGGFMTEHQVEAIARYEAAGQTQRRADADVEADVDLLDSP